MPYAEQVRRGTQPRKPKALHGSGTGPAAMPAASGRDYARIARRYVMDVLEGRVVACRWIRLACARQVRDAQHAKADRAWPYVWSAAQARAACTFIERLPHIEGQWTTATICLEPWQVFLIGLLFGWDQTNGCCLRRMARHRR